VRLELLPTLRARMGADVAIRARREAYAAPVASLKRDVLAIVSALGSQLPVAAPNATETSETGDQC